MLHRNTVIFDDNSTFTFLNYYKRSTLYDPMKKIIIIEVGVVVLIAAIIFPTFKSYWYDNIVNLLNLNDWHFKIKNVLGLEENKSKNRTSFPIAYLAFIRTMFEKQKELLNIHEPLLRSGDYVSTISISPPNPAQTLDQLPFSSDKMKGVTYFSLNEIRNNVQSLKQRGVNFIGYDLENEGSPAIDLSHPVASMREASKIVHQHGLIFMAVPGYPFNTKAYASQFAPYANIYVIQAQNNESQPAIYKSSVISTVNALKAANPNVRIITELSTHEGSLSDMKESFSMVAQYVDGVTVWPESVDDLSKIRGFLEWYNNNYRQ